MRKGMRDNPVTMFWQMNYCEKYSAANTEYILWKREHCPEVETNSSES